MSLLDKLRTEVGIPATPATTATPEPKSSKSSRCSRGPTLLIDIDAAINSWLDHIGETNAALRKGCLLACRRDPELRTYLLHRAQEVPPSDHVRVLQDIQAMPERIRAIEVIDLGVDAVRLIVAIRNVGVCELLVARDRWDPFQFLALLTKPTEQETADV